MKVSVSKESKTSLKKEKLNFSKENIKKFLKLWNEGKTTFEIVNIYTKKKFSKTPGKKIKL